MRVLVQLFVHEAATYVVFAGIASTIVTFNETDLLEIEDLEERTELLGGACACTTSCGCTSCSCVVWF